MKTDGRVDVPTLIRPKHYLQPSGQLHASAALPDGKSPGGGSVGPRVCLDNMENFLPYRNSNSEPSVVQPVAIHYTSCVTAAHILVIFCMLSNTNAPRSGLRTDLFKRHTDSNFVITSRNC
jgi:hypothetical protein